MNPAIKGERYSDPGQLEVASGQLTVKRESLGEVLLSLRVEAGQGVRERVGSEVVCEPKHRSRADRLVQRRVDRLDVGRRDPDGGTECGLGDGEHAVDVGDDGGGVSGDLGASGGGLEIVEDEGRVVQRGHGVVYRGVGVLPDVEGVERGDDAGVGLSGLGGQVLGGAADAAEGDAVGVEREALSVGAEDGLPVGLNAHAGEEPHAAVREPLPEDLDRRVADKEEGVCDIETAPK